MAEPGWGQPIVRAIIIGNNGGASVGVVDQGAPGATPWKTDDDQTQAILAAIQTLLAAGLPSALAADRLKVESTGNVADGVADAGNPIKVGGVFKTTPTVLTNGQRGDATLDVNENLRTTMGTLLSGESQTLNRLLTAGSFLVTTAAAAATTVIKSGVGVMAGIIIPTLVAGGTVKIYDNTAGSGTVLLDTYTVPAAVTPGMGPMFIPLPASFGTGLTVVMTGAAMVADIYYL